MKKYFKDTSNLASFALGLIPAFVFYVLKPNVSVPIWLFLLVISILCIFIWLFIKSRIDILELSPTYFIQIINCSHGVCLCKPNSMIAQSSWVTFYEISGDYEKTIAFGVVQNITQKNVAQIVVHKIDSVHPDILKHINDEKDKIIVRPTITTEAIQLINNLEVI